MAKGTYRKKRLAVLEELEDHDAQWADQIREMRTSNPQAYRKELLKADVFLAAKTGRATTLSMRPKRFGGDEDPVLVRRVIALRKAMPELTRGVEMAPVFGRPGPRVEEGDLGGVDGWRQNRTPESDQADPGGVDGWKQDRTPGFDKADPGGVDGWKQNRTPGFDKADPGGVDGWKQNRSPAYDAAPDSSESRGRTLRGRAPEMVPRPDESTVPRPQTRQSEDRRRPAARGQAQASQTGAPAGPQADLSILDGTIGDFKKALATGQHDAFLDALEAAEKAGKGRKGVLKAIAGRR